MAAELSSSPTANSLQDEDDIPNRSRPEVETNGDIAEEDDDEDEDIVKRGSKKRGALLNADDDDDDDDDDDGGGLFGDEEDEEQEDLGELEKPAKRQLDDEELDSGDDVDRLDRVADEADAEEFVEQEKLTMDVEVNRQPVPEPSDGEMYILKIPTFLSIEPRAWQTTTFQPPTTDHTLKKPPPPTFSAFNTAMTTLRWRHSPSIPSELQSNARINRWSDGSLTLQLASDPNSQYELDGNPLAPRQRNPLKPTPTSIQGGQKNGRPGMGSEERYDPSKDSFTYLVAPVMSADSLRVTHKVTTGLTVKQTESVSDDAVERLQAALASAANATKVSGATGALEVTEEDPELGRKRAEEAERLAMRDRKKRENAQERERLRADRALGRHGLSSGRYSGGLNVGMLEDYEMEGGRGRSTAGKTRAKPRRRRNSEYSDDEDFGRKRFTKEDSYDQDDGFLVGSDEEEEVVEDDENEDSDDGIVEEPSRESKRDRPPSRVSDRVSGAGEDADADGEEDVDMQQSRTKRRRVVDEDEDEE